MRRIGAIFRGTPYLNQRSFDGGGEGCELRAGVNSGEEAVGVMGVGEIAEASDIDFDVARLRDGFEGLPEFREAVFRPVADEFEGNVEVFGRRPVQGGGGAELFEQCGEGLEDGRWNGESGEQTHWVMTFY